VVSSAELQQDWFHPGETVGITAGTSTPPVTIQGIERWLHALSTRWTPEAVDVVAHSPELETVATQ